jgi:hypothetical protein
VDERINLPEMVIFDCPAFTSPEEDVDNVLEEDLVFETEFHILVIEEVA